MSVRDNLEKGDEIMPFNRLVEKILKDNGRTQTWTINKMNEINPSLKMDRCKMSSIIKNNRKISGEELLTFCMALKINPDVFMKLAEKHDTT